MAETRPLPAPARTIIDALEPLVSARRLARIDAVVNARTRSFAVVLDRMHDPHNAAAVMRSADAFGVQEVHVVECGTTLLASERVASGAERWLDIRRWHTPARCLAGLRQRGFEVYVASMEGELGPEALCRRPKAAVVFGNEHAGVDRAWRDEADGSFAIPMGGFVESLNVSVAAAVTMFAATRGRAGDLSAHERDELRARFLMGSVREAEDVVALHLARRERSAS